MPKVVVAAVLLKTLLHASTGRTTSAVSVSSEADQSQISLRKHYHEKARVHERDEVAVRMRKHQRAGWVEPREHHTVVGVFNEREREAPRHTMDCEEGRLSWPTG